MAKETATAIFAALADLKMTGSFLIAATIEQEHIAMVPLCGMPFIRIDRLYLPTV